MTFRLSALRPSIAFRAIILMVAALTLQGCGMIYKTTGDVLVSYGRSNMMPFMLADDDTAMACATGDALTPLLMSFQRVHSHPEKLGVMVYVTASSCAEEKAQEQELRYLRAVNQGNVKEAEDARIEGKRWHAVAGKRQYTAYKYMVKAFGEPKENSCPRLHSDYDQLVYMIGLVSGVQALLSDSASDMQVGVPRDLAPKVERAAGCLDNNKWWGVPHGIQAAIWNILPMLAPKGADPWKILQQSADTGIRQGVRLGSALYAMSAYGKGDKQRLRAAIRQFAKGTHVDPNYKQIDAIAKTLVLNLSDRMWTEATGKRTPIGGLGTFWDDQSSQPSVDINDLL